MVMVMVGLSCYHLNPTQARMGAERGRMAAGVSYPSLHVVVTAQSQLKVLPDASPCSIDLVSNLESNPNSKHAHRHVADAVLAQG